MAILQKTREKAGMAVSIIIALALLSFIIDPQTLETAFNAMVRLFLILIFSRMLKNSPPSMRW